MLRSTHELNRDEINELKSAYLTELNSTYGRGTSWGELAEAESIISDESIHDKYEDTLFSDDDFFCNIA